MYREGDLRISPFGCVLDKDGDCPDDYADDTHKHPMDARAPHGNGKLFGGVFLPHSCNEWIVGGPAEIRALIHDLVRSLIVLEKQGAPHDTPVSPV